LEKDGFRPFIGDVLYDTYQILQVPNLTRCIIVIGTESSGSKLAAQIAAHALVWPDKEFWGHQGWRGHGDAANFSLGHAVLHRSFPHGDRWPYYPDIRGIIGKLEKDGGCDVRLVVATRDSQISLQSKVRTHQRHTRTAVREQTMGTAMLHDLLKQPWLCPTFVWSHEAFMSLQEAYAEHFLDFLFADRAVLDALSQTRLKGRDAESNASALGTSRRKVELPEPYDSNQKYTQISALRILLGCLERLLRYANEMRERARVLLDTRVVVAAVTGLASWTLDDPWLHTKSLGPRHEHIGYREGMDASHCESAIRCRSSWIRRAIVGISCSGESAYEGARSSEVILERTSMSTWTSSVHPIAVLGVPAKN
jgi:hypothetical protein